MIVQGQVRPPGDKSITHRALIVAALLRADAEVQGALTAVDVRSTARVLRQLGVGVSPIRTSGRIRAIGRPWRAPRGSLDCGNSGTAARMILGCLAGCEFEARVTGDGSLRRRPMRRVTAPLIAMGAHIEDGGRDGLPLRIRGGPLRGIEFHSPIASAQLKSAVLLAGVSGRVPVTIVEPYRSRDHTERLFRHLGLPVTVQGRAVVLEGGGITIPEGVSLELDVPGDASSAAFLVGAALLADGGELLIEHVGVNPTRSGFLSVLHRMGADVTRHNEREVAGEPVADLIVRPSRLRGTEVRESEIPTLIDEVPILAVLAAGATGVTAFRSVGELRVKESDRLRLIEADLRSVGARACVEGEDLVIEGTEGPFAGRVETEGDHRIAMAFAVLNTAAAARIELAETASVAISYPRFFADLRQIGSQGHARHRH